MIDVPVYNKEAEEQIIGNLLVWPEFIGDVSTYLSPGDFYNERLAGVYKTILSLQAEDIAINSLTLFDEFIKQGKPELSHYCTELQALDCQMTSGTLKQYAGIVKDKAMRRATMGVMAQTTKSIFDESNPVSDVLLRHEVDMVNLRKRNVSGNGNTVNNERLAGVILETLEDAYKNKDKPKIDFPWRDLANLTGPLNSGTLVGVIAEPGVGKTVFLENCSEAWLKQGWNVALYHHELDTQMMGKRYIQRETGISVKDQANGNIKDDDWGKVFEAAERMTKWGGKLFYEHCPGWTASQIAAHATYLKELHGIDIVIIDYFNKISHTDRPGLNAALSREQDIEELKIMLEVNGLVGVMAAQFDKAARKNSGYKSLADAKETSALEDKSNVGIVINRGKDETGKWENEATFAVVKCNAGQQGVVDVYFKGDRYIFYPAAKTNLNGA